MAKRKADEALTSLFGEYASEDEGSGEEGDAQETGTGALLPQYEEEPAAAAAAAPAYAIGTPIVAEAADLTAFGAAGSSQGGAESEGFEAAILPNEVAALTDDLPASLLEPPKVPVDPDLQARVCKFLASKRDRGVTLKGELAKLRDFRNPDFLQKMVEHFDITEYGTCFAPELFNPKALPREDYYDRLAAEQVEIDRRREEARKQAGRVEFVPGKDTPPSSTAGAMSAAAIVAQAKATASGKRSKWDTAPPASRR